MEESRSGASIEPLSKDEIKWMSALRRREERVETFKDELIEV